MHSVYIYITCQLSAVVHLYYMTEFSRSSAGYASRKAAQIVMVCPLSSSLLKDLTHELFHVLGRLHEHQREDRDSYVKIMWDNIDQCECTIMIYTMLLVLHTLLNKLWEVLPVISSKKQFMLQNSTLNTAYMRNAIH